MTVCSSTLPRGPIMPETRFGLTPFRSFRPEGFQRLDNSIWVWQWIGALGLDNRLILQLVDQGDFVFVFRVENLRAHPDAQV